MLVKGAPNGTELSKSNNQANNILDDLCGSWNNFILKLNKKQEIYSHIYFVVVLGWIIYLIFILAI